MQHEWIDRHWADIMHFFLAVFSLATANVLAMWITVAVGLSRLYIMWVIEPRHRKDSRHRGEPKDPG